MTTIYRPQRTSIAGKRARRTDRAISVIPAIEERADAAPDADSSAGAMSDGEEAP